MTSVEPNDLDSLLKVKRELEKKIMMAEVREMVEKGCTYGEIITKTGANTAIISEIKKELGLIIPKSYEYKDLLKESRMIVWVDAIEAAGGQEAFAEKNNITKPTLRKTLNSLEVVKKG